MRYRQIDRGIGKNTGLLLWVVRLATARVGRMPYPWDLDAENRVWLERYFAAIQDVIDEDICTNTGAS